MQQRARENAQQANATQAGQVVGQEEGRRQQNFSTLAGLGTNASLQQQGVTNQQNQFADTLGLNNRQLEQNQNQFGVTSGQNQQAINNALQIANMNNQLGYYSTDTNNNGANWRAGLGAVV